MLIQLTKRNATLVAAIVAFWDVALLPLFADTYQYIISGYPAANESYSAASAGTAFVTATRAVPSAAQSLEARYRTWDESDGIPFRSDKVWGFNIFIR